MEEFRDDTRKASGRHVHLKNIFAGCFSSTLSRFTCHPLEVLKVRFQLQKIHRKHLKNITTQEKEAEVIYLSIPHGIRQIFRAEGIPGFWRGHTMSQFQGFFQGIALFWTFETVRPYLSLTPIASMPMLCNFTSGFITGTIVVITLSPLDVMRTRVIARKADMQLSNFKMAQHIFNTGGTRQFFTGGYTAVLHVGSLIGCKFMFYKNFCHIGMLMKEHKENEKLPPSVLITAGAASGICSNLVTYPMDLIKRRLQVSKQKSLGNSAGQHCEAIIQCLKLVVHNEGYLGLYKGILPCVVKSAFSTAVQFSAYDKLREWADNHF